MKFSLGEFYEIEAAKPVTRQIHEQPVSSR